MTPFRQMHDDASAESHVPDLDTCVAGEQQKRRLDYSTAPVLVEHSVAGVVVCGVGGGIEEAIFIRWRHITEHATHVPGMKSHNSPRWVPNQAALEPWLEG